VILTSKPVAYLPRKGKFLSQRLFHFCAFLSLAALGTAFSSQAQTVAPPEGIYAGTLQAGEAQLHILLHLIKTSGGSYRATLDSLDQGVFAIEASSVSISGAAVRLDVASNGAHFEGKFSANHKSIEGTWSQGGASLPLTFTRQPAGGISRKAADALFPVEGLWQGALETHGMRLRFQLHVSHDTEGELIGALDNLDQGVSGLPGVKLTQKESAFHFEIPAVGGVFEGTLNAAKNELKGTWSQTGAENEELNFKRGEQPLELRRPQNPVRPYAYREEEVSFSNEAAHVTLSGTLTLPKTGGPFPGVVLIAGSGPHDRDESIANHKPFLVLADFLTQKGIAVLRYDKRGMGKSAGVLEDATTIDLAGDTAAAVAFLQARKEFDANKIGLIGHSEGGIIASYLASRSKGIAWLVLLAAPATTGQDTLLKQSELIGRAGGLEDAQLVASLTFDREAYDLIRQEKDHDALAEKLVALVKETGFDAALPPAALEAQLRTLLSPWFRYFLDYDPLPNLRAVRCPVLALYGQKDLQVASKVNLPLMKSALDETGIQDVDVRELPELNHLFQHAYSGSPAEYAAIEETISPEVLQLAGEWAVDHSH
jgi:pimeloyl-ACP methyl ester carboxylesterase